MNRRDLILRYGAIMTGIVLCTMPVITDATPAGRFHTNNQQGDLYGVWVRNSMKRLSPTDLGNFWPFQDDSVWEGEFLETPGSIYSDLHPRMFTSNGDDIPGDEDIFPRARSRAAKAMAWDLGLDKALAGYQAPVTQHSIETGGHAPVVKANYTKAGVMTRYFQKAYDIGNNNLYTINAELAVAVQILHEWVEATDAVDRFEMGVYDDVLLRFERATSLRDMTDADLAYLADILRGELSTWRAGRLNAFGYREIPTPLRIARVAAAYASTQEGYLACQPDSQRDMSHAGTIPEQLDKPICFTDANDRAVYRWYREKRKAQLAVPPREYISVYDMASAGRIVDAFADIKPAWAGAFATQALDWSNHAEVVEAQMAAQGDPTRDTDMDFYRLVERANLLVCRSATR